MVVPSVLSATLCGEYDAGATMALLKDGRLFPSVPALRSSQRSSTSRPAFHLPFLSVSLLCQIYSLKFYSTYACVICLQAGIIASEKDDQVEFEGFQSSDGTQIVQRELATS